MKVICIGGPNDGEWHFAPDEARINDWIKVPKKLDTVCVNFDLDLIPNVSISYNEYRLSRFHFSKDDVYWFMVPIDWTDKQGIKYSIERKNSKLFTDSDLNVIRKLCIDHGFEYGLSLKIEEVQNLLTKVMNLLV